MMENNDLQSVTLTLTSEQFEEFEKILEASPPEGNLVAKEFLKRPSRWAEQEPAYTAVDVATADADGFRNGRASVVVELPTWQCLGLNQYTAIEVLEVCKKAIIAAGGTVKS